MVNKRMIIAGVLIIFVALAVTISVRSDERSGVATPNAKEPPEVQQVPDMTPIRVLTLTEGESDITCQQPPNGNEYGGISGTENNPPKGTVLDPSLTEKYGKPTATGTCGTYWYIVGWWFNATEIAKLPQETLMYGVSPYAITSGSGESRQSSDNWGDEPIIPVPEVAGIILVSLGVVVLVILKKMKSK